MTTSLPVRSENYATCRSVMCICTSSFSSHPQPHRRLWSSMWLYQIHWYKL